MTRDYVKYKTFEELKEELGDKFEDYMYKANINLLNKLHKIKEIMDEDDSADNIYMKLRDYLEVNND